MFHYSHLPLSGIFHPLGKSYGLGFGSSGSDLSSDLPGTNKAPPQLALGKGPVTPSLVANRYTDLNVDVVVQYGSKFGLDLTRNMIPTLIS